MKYVARGLAASALALAALSLGAGAARAADPVITVGADGKTAPVFSYADAKRERVWIPVAGVDQDADGVTDRVAIDIIRPKESGPDLKVPAIIDDSPYYTSVGRGNETQFIHTTAGRRAGQVPALLRQLLRPARLRGDPRRTPIGTAFSTGCPLHGGPGDVAGFKAVIDWTRGPRPRLHVVDRRDPRPGGLVQRQERHDRQVLRRHVRQRRRVHGRRRPDDDRPDLGDLRLVRLLAHGRHPGEHPLPAQPRQQHHRDPVAGARSACCRPTIAPRARTCSRTCDLIDGDADGDINHVLERPRLQPRTSARSRPPSSSRTASTTTTSARIR